MIRFAPLEETNLFPQKGNEKEDEDDDDKDKDKGDGGCLASDS